MIAWLKTACGAEQLIRNPPKPLPAVLKIPLHRPLRIDDPEGPPLTELCFATRDFRLIARGEESATYEEILDKRLFTFR